jgi:uracil-DNA glycosylase
MQKKIIGNKWDELLADEWQKPYYQELRSFLIDEYRDETVYPPAADIYNALRFTDYDNVKVVILGQDPYHEPGQAHGMAFSVREGVALPPSLVNILKELRDDLSIDMAEKPDGPDSTRGVLDPWARQGVLLLNTVLTVRAHQAGSHRGKGWERFTDRVIELLAERETPLVFILWGSNAGAKKDLIVNAQQGRLRHLIITAPHPSPLSAYRGFFGGCYFSRCNYFLEDNGISPVDWRL